jgi:hypothetical protein
MAAQLVFPFLQPPPPRAATKGRVRALATLPRMAPAAVRVPELVREPAPYVFPSGTPQIFVHEGVRQALERRLCVAANLPVVLSITDNRHSMIRHARQGGALRVRLHHMFLGAPASVQDALVSYLVHGDRQASFLVGQFINSNLQRIKPRRRAAMQLVTRGKHHDLLALFNSLNEAYFGGSVDALITFGRPGRRGAGPRKSIKLGSYNAVERMIAIHPALDKLWVPRYFVAFVVFHEMIHHLVPASRGHSRANLHPAEFRERERGFRFYERALAWERAHIGRLLRA